MKKILLTTNFTKNSKQACRYALQLFQGDDIKYTLFNTYRANSLNSTEFKLEALGNTLNQKPYSLLEKELSTITQDHPSAATRIKTHCEFGHYGYTLGKFANDYQPDLMVMGLRKKGWFQNLIAKIRPGDIIHKLPSPILRIPSGATFTPPKSIKLYMHHITSNRMDEECIKPLRFLSEKYSSNIDATTVLDSDQRENFDPSGNLPFPGLHKYVETHSYHEENSVFNGEAPDSDGKKSDLIAVIHPRQASANWLNNTLADQYALRHKIPVLHLFQS